MQRKLPISVTSESTPRNLLNPNPAGILAWNARRNAGRTSRGDLSSLAREERGEDRLGFELPLLNFQLSQIALQRDVDFVPLIFQASEGSLAQFAQITNRRRAAQKRMNVTFSGGAAID